MIKIKILCLDQATKISGYSVFEDGNLVDYGVVKIKKKENDGIERIRLMNEEIIKLIKKVNPNFIVFEDVQFQRNYGTFKQLSQLQGVIMAYLFKLNIGFQIIEPSAWKSFCSIKGRKRAEQKKNTQIFVKDKYGKEVSEDEADAIGIGTWASKNIIQKKI